MYRNKTITVCLPCRNEAPHLHKVIEKIPSFVDEIIVISNKSTDATIETAQKLGLTVIEDNRTLNGIGYGYAHMSGIAQARSDIIVAADGDGTYPIENLAEILDRFIDETIDFMSCNRYPITDGTTIPLRLRLGVWLLNTEVRLLYGLKINDILSGMWVFKNSIAEGLTLSMGDWNLSPEIKINAATNSGIQFKEHNISQHQRLGHSHQQYFKTGLSHALWILKHRLTRQTELVPQPNEPAIQSEELQA